MFIKTVDQAIAGLSKAVAALQKASVYHQLQVDVHNQEIIERKNLVIYHSNEAARADKIASNINKLVS